MGDLTVSSGTIPAPRLAETPRERGAGFRFLSPLEAPAGPPVAPHPPQRSVVPTSPAGPLDAPAGISGVPTRPVSIRLRAAGPELANTNPGRGFYRDLTGDATIAPGSPGEVRALDAALVRAHADGRRLVFATVNLAAYRNQALDPAMVRNLEAGLTQVRDRGMQAILRFTYNNPANETDYRGVPDAPGSRILEHIRQLTPALTRNADTVFALQAGFSGAWGEWHSSTNGNDTAQWRGTIAKALLEAYPRDVQFRYPAHVMDFARSGMSDRVALHNDCFLASPTDVGTYSDNPAERARQKAFVAQRTLGTVYGGETCNPKDDPQPQPRLSCEAILTEGRDANLTYLGDDYYRAFKSAWRASGCYPEVEARMGYRVRLDQVSMPTAIRPGTSVALGIDITNDGMASVHANNGVALHLRNTSTGQQVTIPMRTDVAPRQWAKGQTHTTATADIPSGLAPGTYAVGIGFPPLSARLTHPSQTIRPANADDRARRQFWEDGVFYIGHAVEVAG